MSLNASFLPPLEQKVPRSRSEMLNPQQRVPSSSSWPQQSGPHSWICSGSPTTSAESLRRCKHVSLCIQFSSDIDNCDPWRNYKTMELPKHCPDVRLLFCWVYNLYSHWVCVQNIYGCVSPNIHGYVSPNIYSAAYMCVLYAGDLAPGLAPETLAKYASNTFRFQNVQACKHHSFDLTR